jgi:hypothetical protein
VSDTKYGISEDGNTAIYAFHMYNVGDRLLEGIFADVQIDLEVTPPTVLNITFKPNDQAYMAKLNVPYWVEQAREVCQEEVAEMAARGVLLEILQDIDENGYIEW